MADKRQVLMNRIARKKMQHQSTVMDHRALVRATTRRLRKEIRKPTQPSLPL